MPGHQVQPPDPAPRGPDEAGSDVERQADPQAAAPPRLPAFGTNIAALDGVRGISILMILWFHYEIVGWRFTSPIGRAVGIFTGLSWTGLELFFVLSGFLITGILYETRTRPRYFRNFYMRRVLRIVPLYYGALLVLFVVLPAVGALAPTPFHWQIWYWGHATNFLFAFHGGQGPREFTRHFWSLSVEEQYYFVWPLVVLLLSRRKLIAVCIAASVTGLILRLALFRAGVAFPTVFMMTPTHLDGLAVGSLAALAVRGEGGLPAVLRYARLAAPVAALMMAAIFVWRGTLAYEDKVTASLGYPILAVLLTCVVLWAVALPQGSRALRVLCNPAIRLVGVRSYGLYVFHIPVIEFLQKHGLGLPDLTARLGGVLPGQLAWLGLNLAGAFGLTMASWHLYERHFMKLKRLFDYRPAAAAPGRAMAGGASPAVAG